MSLLRRITSVPSTAGAAARLAAAAPTGAVLAAGLLGETARTARGTVRAAVGAGAALARDSLALTRTVVVSGTRAVGTLVTGGDPLPEGHLHDLVDAAQGMVEPPLARHTRRVWVDRGRVQIELCTPAEGEPPDARRTLRRHLERLEGVEWATVNDVVGRVLVAFDARRITAEDVVGAVTAIEQARGRRRLFPRTQDHPADLEPLLAALVEAAIDTAAVGVAYAAKVLPIPALTRHATLAVALLDSQQWIKEGLERRIGPIGTDLVFTGTSALLHALTQSPTVPTLNAAAALQAAVEMRARRQVWRRRERELCGREPDEGAEEPLQPPGPRPRPLPPGPIETYEARLGPTELAAAVGLLLLTGRPDRSADLLKVLTPKPAVQGREAFAAALDLLMCRRDVLPMDGSAYRRLDRVDVVVADGDALCTGPPVVIAACAAARGWDDAAVWSAAARLLGATGPADGAAEQNGGRLRLGPPRPSPDVPGAAVHRLFQGRRRLGSVTVAPELDPHAEALLTAAADAGHRLVLTAHAGIGELAGAADEVAPPEEPLVGTVRRLQAAGSGVLLVSAQDGAGLLAADVAVAPLRAGCAPAWAADLVTRPGLADACRLVAGTADARAVSRRSVATALTGNVLGSLLAAVGSPRAGQRRATTPGKTATAVTMLAGAAAAVRVDARPIPPPAGHTPWHALDAEEVLRRLADLPREPARRPPSLLAPLQRVRAHPGVRVPARLARTVAAELADPLTPVLAAGAAATAILGEATDAVLVGSVTAGNALIGGLQRLRAETALESLLLEQDVVVHRETDGGGREDVPGSALRIGDVVQVEPGDVLACDARLLAAADLEVDESSLTGESLAVGKSVAATPGAEVAERSCMLFAGTTVVAGSGRAVVVAVGDATQAGRATRAAGAAAPPAGVQARLGELTRQVLPLTLAGGAAVTALGVLWRRPLRAAVRDGVAVAVAAVPEGLPLVATVAQQAAARRLSGRGAVVRSARVLEALGRVDTVCFDKTGTLTENRLRVVRLLPLGPDDPGEDGLLGLAAAGVGNGDERAHETDRAVVEAAAARGLGAGGEAGDSLPFAAGRGFSAAVRGGRLVVKGAPEVVLARCPAARDVRARVRELAGDGLRVLAVAERPLDGPPGNLEEAAHGLTLRGLVGLADTVRDSSVRAVQQLTAAGVRVVVATGDHPGTASAIARQAGVPDADRVVTGAELARAPDSERTRLVREAAVFARLSPEQKVALVAALRRAGATLAMTGDGVNDAAAIRLADVGVGVSGAESPAARAAADLVLTDLDLTRLVDAIGEGRALWSRVRDAVSVLVGGNAGEVAFTVLGTAFGGRAPLNTRQLLLVNLLTDMFPAMAVAVAAPRGAVPAEDDGPLAGHRLAEALRAGPRRGFTREVRRLVLVRGAATAAGATAAWGIGRLTGPRGRAGTMGLAALIATQLGQTAWAGRRSPLVLVTAAGSLAVLAGVVQTPGVSRFFGCIPLDPLSWLVVLACAAAATAGAEVARRWPTGWGDDPAQGDCSFASSGAMAASARRTSATTLPATNRSSSVVVRARRRSVTNAARASWPSANALGSADAWSTDRSAVARAVSVRAAGGRSAGPSATRSNSARSVSAISWVSSSTRSASRSRARARRYCWSTSVR
ncbi:cation-translocating P-type ATPase [Geodermatophilus ruber]|uniref:Cation-transporting ATPase I n=1 Tax=Geodermatophilus ruber TaxID=504800 RepID=A0A1I4FA73_9ACTN|nr:cation-translocating P-type ATPase [Geodermatophilus ruber]SFL14363.1 cation-transporting ATPase I [Geodermatophilus ruber]